MSSEFEEETAQFANNEPVDVSDYFWSFVELLILTNGSDDLRDSPEYEFFGTYRCHPMKIRKCVLVPTSTDLLTFYTFDHINDLMYNAKRILKQNNCVSKLYTLQRAIKVMCDTIELDQSLNELSLSL